MFKDASSSRLAYRVRRPGIVVSVILLVLITPVLTAKAFEYDDDTWAGSVNGHWWQAQSYIFLDTGGGGWVYNGGSSTTKNTALEYVYVRGRGTETCGVWETDTDWDEQSYGGAIIVSVNGSGFSSAGSCSWYWVQPCKAFDAKGSHRADDYDQPQAWQTHNTDAWVLEVGTC